MNVLTRQIVYALGIALLTAIIVPALIFYVYPLENWRDLWEMKLLNLSFIIAFPSILLFVGTVYGILSGTYWRRQMNKLRDDLQLVEQGRPIQRFDDYSLLEFRALAKQAEQIQKLSAEQAKLSQKLATEKAEDQEKRIQEIVSQERNRLARELHDSVSQQLFAASMLMSAVTEDQVARDVGQDRQLAVVEGIIHQAQLEMRALLLHLRPVPLRNKSLQEGIQELLEELAQKVPMKIDWKTETLQLDKGIEDHLFRILQESVSNTLRHAKANSIDVLLIERDGMVILRIVDDGIGFELDQTKTGSYGLQNMKERAVELGGSLKIVSVPRNGTRLEVKIPLLGGRQND